MFSKALAVSLMSGLDLSDLCLDRSDFYGVNFNNTLLINTQFYYAILTYANFKDANLQGANLQGTMLDEQY
ncbi:MAG: pentapeptide repeat-containing protein [Thiotrichaceae bacterium]|nr:pentapeptide repeat-containing protein [Thiotrichaceae bacterium]